MKKKYFKIILRPIKIGEKISLKPNEYVFGSFKEMLKYLSPGRCEVYKAIRDSEVDITIKSLSKILKKDYRNLTKDIHLLEMIGLIEIESDVVNGVNCNYLYTDYDDIKLEKTEDFLEVIASDSKKAS